MMYLNFRRRCKIAEVLVEKNFDLAFLLIYEFNLPGNIDFPLYNLVLAPQSVVSILS